MRFFPVYIFCFVLNGFALLIPPSGNAQLFDNPARQGIEDYNAQNYSSAVQSFKSAKEDQPDNPGVDYNLGNSFYKQGKFQEALSGYSQAASGESKLKQNALYNSGNALYRLGKLEESIASYKEALKLDPTDMDAKFNLEYARLQLKKKEQEQEQKKDSASSDPKDKKQNDDDKKKKDKDKAQDKKPDEENAKNQPSQNPQDKKESRREETQTAQARPKESMSKQEAEQWLRSLEEAPKKFNRKQALEEIFESPAYQGNDW